MRSVWNSDGARPAGEGRILLGETSSARIGRMVKDVVEATFSGNLSIRMSPDAPDATLAPTFLFTAVYENEVATAEFKKATGILGGLLGEDPRAS